MSLGQNPFWDLDYPVLVQSRKPSHYVEIPVDTLCEPTALQRAVEKVQWQLAEEVARLKRILPEAPYGYQWHFDYQTSEADMTGKMTFRVVASLR